MRTKKRFAIFLGFLVLHQSTIYSRAASYTVKGSLSYQAYRLRAEQPSIAEEPLLREFEVQSDEFGWRIRMVLVGNTNFDSFIYSYDGTNLFQCAAVANPGGAMPSASVQECAVPATETSAGGEYVWLAFASGNHLKAQANKALLSFQELRSSNGWIKRFQQPADAILTASPPFLPTAVDYFMTNAGAFLDRDGQLHALPLPTSFEGSNYLSAAFKADGFTNVNGLRFPTKFVYTKYQPKANARTTNDLSRVLTVSATVKTISVSEHGVECTLPKRIMIFDRRVPEPNVMYAIADGLIPAVDTDIVATARTHARDRQQQRR